MQNNAIVYRPTLAGRIAKVLLPVMNKVLPNGLYASIYNVLYSGYKSYLARKYILRRFFVNAFGSDDERLKAKLVVKLLPYSMGGHKALENAFDVTLLAERDGIVGDIVECGVAQGGTAAMMLETSRLVGSGSRHKWFFDSYEGLPEPTLEDYENGKTGDFIRPLPKGSCLGTIEQVGELMFGVLSSSKDEVSLVKGWFQDTLPSMSSVIKSIAILRLDGDWYESTKIPLEHLYPLVSPGGIVVIDDYATCFGSRRATDEYRNLHSINTPLNEDGRGGIWFRKP